jgi:hypothetical protein
MSAFEVVKPGTAGGPLPVGHHASLAALAKAYRCRNASAPTHLHRPEGELL